MGGDEIFALLAPYGASGVFGYVAWRLFKSAIDAHTARADAWEKAAIREGQRADLRDQQLWHILSAVKTTTDADAAKDGA